MKLLHRFFAICLIGILSIIFAVSLLSVFYKCNDDVAGKLEYKALRKVVFHFENPKTIDETYLKSVNSDYAAWIYIPDTVIDYPVVWSDSNQKYLRCNFNGEKRGCGTLFFDSSVSPFSSLNTIIHGHNMRSGEMFGQLKKYLLNEDYLREHLYIYVYLRGIWKQYKIISVYTIGNMDISPYKSAFSSKDEFINWLKVCSNNNESTTVNFKEGEDISEILTLSTCHGKSQKLIIQAILISN